jgi:hypothetical protein
MHAFGAADVVAAELLEPPDEPPALEVLLPHAAASSATTMNAAAVLMVPLTITLLHPRPVRDARRLDPFTFPRKR